jgi:hypothetical protein
MSWAPIPPMVATFIMLIDAGWPPLQWVESFGKTFVAGTFAFIAVSLFLLAVGAIALLIAKQFGALEECPEAAGEMAQMLPFLLLLGAACTLPMAVLLCC